MKTAFGFKNCSGFFVWSKAYFLSKHFGHKFDHTFFTKIWSKAWFVRNRRSGKSGRFFPVQPENMRAVPGC